jgi:hypothetical protein
MLTRAGQRPCTFFKVGALKTHKDTVDVHGEGSEGGEEKDRSHHSCNNLHFMLIVGQVREGIKQG